MMSLEEFYSAIADAYSVAKGERSHYTKEEKDFISYAREHGLILANLMKV